MGSKLLFRHRLCRILYKYGVTTYDKPSDADRGVMFDRGFNNVLKYIILIYRRYIGTYVINGRSHRIYLNCFGDRFGVYFRSFIGKIVSEVDSLYKARTTPQRCRVGMIFIHCLARVRPYIMA